MDSGLDDSEVGQYDGSVTIPCHGKDSPGMGKHIRPEGTMPSTRGPCTHESTSRNRLIATPLRAVSIKANFGGLSQVSDRVNVNRHR